MIHILIYSEDTRHEIYFKEVFSKKVSGARLTVCDDPDMALAVAMNEQVDLLIADILSIRGGKNIFTGFHFLERFRSWEEFRYTFMVVLSDLEDETYYAYNRLHCFEYFMKPLNEKVFLDEIIPLCRYLERNREVLTMLRNPIHCFRHGRELLIFREQEMVRFELHTKHGIVVTLDGEYYVEADTIRSDDGLINSERFIRCSRCDYVNVSYIRRVNSDRVLLAGKLGEVYLTPIGRRNLERYFLKLK